MPSKHAPKALPNPATLIAAHVDELGALERELTPHKPKLDRVEALRKMIRAAYNDAEPTQAFEASGQHFLIAIGPRATQRSVDLPALIKAIGLKAYAAIASVTLTALDYGVPGAIAQKCVTSAATGARSLKLFERGTTGA